MSDTDSVKDRIATALNRVIDPEVGVNIVDLGLVYRAEVSGERVVVTMTMTTPACPLSSYFRREVDDSIRGQLPEIKEVEVDIVWDPPWNPEMMSEAAKLQLGWR